MARLRSSQPLTVRFQLRFAGSCSMECVSQIKDLDTSASLLSAEQALQELTGILDQAVHDRPGCGADRGILYAAGNGVVAAGAFGSFFTQLVVTGTAFRGFLLAGLAFRFLGGSGPVAWSRTITGIF